jgi:hypothetical protein
MSKVTAHQRHLRQGQPYTQVMPIGGIFLVIGNTLEEEQDKDGNYFKKWMQHDLGQFATGREAFAVAAEWRDGLVGSYA